MQELIIFLWELAALIILCLLCGTLLGLTAAIIKALIKAVRDL